MVTDMLDAAVMLKALAVALLVFGLTPGLVLRLLTLAFHREDPRREELRAELHAVPRIERPFWVVEQLEVVVFEGLRDRIEWALTGRLIHRWSLGNGVESNRLHPETFYIPSAAEKARVSEGTLVKLMFNMKDGWGERMWVEVTEVRRNGFVGYLSNMPLGIPRLEPGRVIRFTADEIIDIVPETALPADKIID